VRQTSSFDRRLPRTAITPRSSSLYGYRPFHFIKHSGTNPKFPSSLPPSLPQRRRLLLLAWTRGGPSAYGDRGPAQVRLRWRRWW
jgi:hypothetical protein